MVNDLFSLIFIEHKLIRVFENSIQNIEIHDWYEIQCKEADEKREFVKEFMQIDRPIGLVYQSNEYFKNNQPIFFEQFYNKEEYSFDDQETPTPGVREDIEKMDFSHLLDGTFVY